MAGPMMNNAGVVPTDQSSTASGGTDLVSSILAQQRTISSEITNTLPSAMTPVRTSGVSSPTLPGAFKFNPNAMPNQQAQGKADATRKGVAKTIAGAVGVIGGFVQAKQAEKTRVLAGDIHKILEAQDSMSQASEILKSDPQNKEAKASLDKSKQIINDIASEPKKAKQLEKAFNINHVDPTKNVGTEADAMKMASKSFADRLAASTPDKLVPNQQAQAKIAALQAQAKQNDDTLKTIVPMVDRQMQEEGANTRAAAHNQTVSDNVAATNAAKTAEATAKNQTEIASARIRAQGAATSAAISGSYRLKSAVYTANKAYDKAIDTVDERAEMLSNIKDPAKRAAVNRQTASVLQKQLNDIQPQIHMLEENRKQADSKSKDGYDKSIQLLEAQQKDYTERLSTYAKTGEFPSDQVSGGGSANGTNDQSGRSQAPATTAGESDDYSDPNNSIYDSPQ